nr:hypothetical protein [Luteipulveratus halotolerans]
MHDQKALNPAKVKNPSRHRPRSTALERVSPATDASRLKYRTGARWVESGSHSQTTATSTVATAAAAAKVPRQLCAALAASDPPVRASRTPTKTPLMTLPVTAPRCAGAERVAACATRIGAPTAQTAIAPPSTNSGHSAVVAADNAWSTATRWNSVVLPQVVPS